MVYRVKIEYKDDYEDPCHEWHVDIEEKRRPSEFTPDGWFWVAFVARAATEGIAEMIKTDLEDDPERIKSIVMEQDEKRSKRERRN